MFEFLSAPDDVIAIRASGKLLRQDLEALVGRIERSLEARDKTHMFVELTQFTGMELGGLPDHLLGAGRMLRKLQKFGRIAIVADQSWLRLAARLESAVLPNVSYAVFLPQEREQALRWVLGEEASPHGAAWSPIPTDAPSVVAFEIDGRLAPSDLRAITAHFGERIAAGGRLNVLGRVKRIGGFEPGGLLEQEFFAMKRDLADRIDRYAVVGGPPWLRQWVRMLDGLLRIEVRHFDADAEEEAWAWVGARPAGPQAAA